MPKQMKNIHPEFAYQSRELGIQIEDTLGEPPDRKHYALVIQSLIDEFANGFAMDDVNLLSFALADRLRFDDPAGLMAQCMRYDDGDAAQTRKLVSCVDDGANKALDTVFASDPDLARKAVITAFLYKNQARWLDEDHSLDALHKAEGADEDDEEEDQLTPGHNIDHLFDTHGEENV